MVGLSGSRSDSSLSFGEARERLELNHLNSRNFVRATSKKRHSGGLETLKHYNKLSISPPQARKKMGKKLTKWQKLTKLLATVCCDQYLGARHRVTNTRTLRSSWNIPEMLQGRAKIILEHP